MPVPPPEERLRVGAQRPLVVLALGVVVLTRASVVTILAIAVILVIVYLTMSVGASAATPLDPEEGTVIFRWDIDAPVTTSPDAVDATVDPRFGLHSSATQANLRWWRLFPFPSTAVTGNLPGTAVVNAYTFTIPADPPAGTCGLVIEWDQDTMADPDYTLVYPERTGVGGGATLSWKSFNNRANANFTNNQGAFAADSPRINIMYRGMEPSNIWWAVPPQLYSFSFRDAYGDGVGGGVAGRGDQRAVTFPPGTYLEIRTRPCET